MEGCPNCYQTIGDRSPIQTDGIDNIRLEEAEAGPETCEWT